MYTHHTRVRTAARAAEPQSRRAAEPHVRALSRQLHARLSRTAVCDSHGVRSAVQYLPLAHGMRDKAVAFEMLRQKRFVEREAVGLGRLQHPGLEAVADGVASSL